MKNKRLAVGVVFIVVSFAVFFFPPVKLPFIDHKGESYFHDSLKKSALIYSVVRGLNAGISVIKDSELNIAPAGVGATIAVGEILDPIDDLVERFSYIILISLISIGIQKTLFFFGIDIFLKLLSVGLFFTGVYFLSGKKIFYSLGVKIVIFAVLVRFLLPASALFTQFSYNTLFKEKVEEAKRDISAVVEILKQEEDLKDNSVMGKLKNLQNSFEKRIETVKNYSSKIIDSIIVISTAFVFQNVLLPVFIVWVFVRSVQMIVRLQI